MTITIEPPPDVEEAIIRSAARKGITPEEYILSAAVEKVRAEETSPESATPIDLPPGTTYMGVPVADYPILALFAKWEADDPVMGPEDFVERQREGDALIASIQANRLSIPRDSELVALVESMEREDQGHEETAA